MNKHDLFKVQMEQLNIDIFTFCESWLTKYIPDKMISIDG